MSPRRLALAALALAFPLVALRAQVRPLEEIAPAGAVAFIKLRDAAMVRPYLDGSHSIFQEAWVKTLLRKAGLNHEELASEFQRETGLALGDVLGTLEGASALCLFMNEQKPDDPGVLVLVGVKDGEGTAAIFKKLKASIEEKSQGSLVKAEDEDVAGVPAWRMDLRKGEDQVESTFLCHHGGRILASQRRELIEQALLAAQGKDVPVLAKREDCAAVLAKLGTARDVAAWVDFAPIVQMLKRTEMRRPKDQKIFAALGLEAIRGFGFGLGLTDRALETTAFVHAPSPRSGLLKILSPECGQNPPDRFAPAEAVQAGAFYVDFPNLVRDIRAIAEAVEPGSGEEIDGFLGMAEDEIGVDLQKDLLALLTPPLHYVDMPRGEGQAATESRTLLYCRSPDAKKLATTIRSLCDRIPEGLATIEDQEYMGTKVTTITIEAGLPMTIPSPAFCSTDTHFFLSLGGAPVLHRALRTLGKEVKPLADTPEYKRTMAGFPEHRLATSFARLDAVLGDALEALKGITDLLPSDPDVDGFTGILAEIDAKTIVKKLEYLGGCFGSDAAGLYLAARVTFTGGGETPKEPK